MPNVAENMFKKGNFRQAKIEFEHFLRTNPNHRQAQVWLAICELRLGDRHAIDSITRLIGHSLTAEDKQLMVEHEFISMLVDKRFEPAIDLLFAQHPTTREMANLSRFREIIGRLRRADGGRGMKIESLQAATQYAKAVKLSRSSGPLSDQINILLAYFELMIELMKGKMHRDASIIARSRGVLSVDRGLLASLPADRRLVDFRPTFRS